MTNEEEEQAEIANRLENEGSENEDFDIRILHHHPSHPPPPLTYHPTPKKSRMTAFFKDQAKELEPLPSNIEDEDTNNDSVDECPICFEPWTSGGLHRICSLRCGHLFGKQCIETWLNNGVRTKCPQCNHPASRKDIRVLFVKKLVAIDTTERDTLREQLDEEKLARRIIQDKEGQLLIKYNLALAEINMLRAQLEKTASFNDNLTDKDAISLNEIKFKRAVTFGAETQCRGLCFDPHLQMFMVGYVRNTLPVKTCGVAKISLVDTKVEHMPLHDQLVKNFCCSPFHDGLLLSVSFDKTLKLTSLDAKSTLLTYDLKMPGWSCAFDQLDRNLLYAGLANGNILKFDVRNTREPVWTALASNMDTFPIHSLASQKTEEGETLLSTASANHCQLVKLNESENFEPIWSRKVSDCCSFSASDKAEQLLISSRGTQAKHQILEKQSNINDSMAYCLKESVECKNPQVNMTRSSLLAMNDNLYLSLNDGPTAIIKQYSKSTINDTVLSINSADYVLDTALANLDKRLLAGLLSNRQFHIFS